MYNHCESTLNSLQIKASESFRELVAHRLALREDPFFTHLGGLGTPRKAPEELETDCTAFRTFQKAPCTKFCTRFHKRPQMRKLRQACKSPAKVP